jgi:CBS domain containing-hemolysin-like protein
MSNALAWIAVSVALAVTGMTVSRIRASLLVLGEERFSEAADKGNVVASRIRDAARDAKLRFPFSIWVVAAILKIASAMAAGCAAVNLWLRIPGWAGPVLALALVPVFFPILFILENSAVQQGLAHPERVLKEGMTPLLLRGSVVPAAVVETVGGFLFKSRFSPETLMDVRIGSEEGILTVIEKGAEQGKIDPSESRMIEGIIRYGGRTVSQEMTPRSEVVFIRQGVSFDEVARIVRETTFTRYPVLSESGEDLVGVLTARSLVLACEATPWSAFLEKLFYVPESMEMADLFLKFGRARTHMAIVIDEHGMLSGVITIDDVLERILGSLAGNNGDNSHKPRTRGNIRRHRRKDRVREGGHNQEKSSRNNSEYRQRA